VVTDYSKVCVKKLIVRTLTFSECDRHEPILTGQVGAVINRDLGQRRVTCISGRVRHQRTSASSVVIEGKSEALRMKSSTRLSASFCRAITLLATPLAKPLSFLNVHDMIYCNNRIDWLIDWRNLNWCSWNARQHQFNFIRRLSWSISSNFGVNSLLKYVSQPKIAKKVTVSPPFSGFRVVQGHFSCRTQRTLQSTRLKSDELMTQMWANWALCITMWNISQGRGSERSTVLTAILTKSMEHGKIRHHA